MPLELVNQAQSIEDPSGVFPQAQLDAVDITILEAAIGGVTGVSSGCLVSAQGTPDMTVAVASGTVVINLAEIAVSSGNVTITAAHATLDRFDLIVVNSSGVKSAVAGTAASTPVFPAIPANSVVVAAVFIPATVTSITPARIKQRSVRVPSPVGTAGWITVEKSATTSRVNTSTLAADPDLSFVMAANGEYRIRGRLFYDADTGDPDIKIRLVQPASPVRMYVRTVVSNRTTGQESAWRVDTAVWTTDFTDLSSAATPNSIWFEGVIHNGATGGNFEIHWAQNTLDAADAVRMWAGSYLEYARVD